MKTGIELIAQERKDQLEKHGRTTSNDIIYNDNNQLIIAAIRLLGDEKYPEPPDGWHGPIWDKMVAKPKKERRIIAGALVAADIDRLQALELLEYKKPTPPQNEGE